MTQRTLSASPWSSISTPTSGISILNGHIGGPCGLNAERSLNM